VSIHVTRRTSQGGWLPAVLLVSRSQRPDWSPDGRWIAFTQGARVPEPGPVTLIPAGGGASRALFQPSASAPPAENPQWAPDNRTIYYKSHDSTGLTTFWALPASGGAPRLVARLADPARQSNRMDFATDGKRLYFAIEDRQSDVYVANLIAR
jgi:Tol biopolymer transport system component